MNCAPVSVAGKSGSSFTGPKMHEANIFGAGTCNTVEGIDTVYPNPGQFVLIGGAYKTSGLGPVTQLANCPFNENENLTTSGGSVSSSASSTTNSGKATSNSTSDPASSVSSSSSHYISSDNIGPTAVLVPPVANGAAGGEQSTSTVVATVTADSAVASTPVADPPAVTPAATVAPVPITAAASNSTISGAGQSGASCPTDGAIVCSSDGQSFYMCDHGALVSMGSVAAGTSCSNGQITRKRSIPPQLHRRAHGHKSWF
jgi:hypothetical protein